MVHDKGWGLVGSAVGFIVAVLVFGTGRRGSDFILWAACVLLALCGVVVVVIYLYVALSGGVMGFDERMRHQERLREARRAHW